MRITSNVDVVGHLTGNSYSIHVEIRKPFRNLSIDCYIPSMARGHCSYEGLYGELRAKQILEDLYHIAAYVNLKHGMLKTKLDENRQQIKRASVCRLTVDEFSSRRRELRKKLRAGQIPLSSTKDGLVVGAPKRNCCNAAFGKSKNNSGMDIFRP